MSWDELLEILDEGGREASAEAAAGRRVCPHDATPLVRDAEGVWRCGFCGWPRPSGITGES